MSYNKFAWGICACAALSFGAWLFFNTNTNAESSPPIKTLKQDQSVVMTKQDDNISSKENSNNASPIDINNILSSPEVTNQIETAIKSYEEISKYPPHSQPILSHSHINSFINANTPESSLPYPFDGIETPIQLSLKIEKYNYFFGDTINASVSISDTPDNATISGRSVLMSIDGNVLAESDVEFEKDTNIEKMKITFDTTSYDAQDWPLEVNIGAYVDVNGNQMFISAPFKINTATATLESVGYSEPKIENLVIPVNFDVTLSGYYFIAAILYSAQSNLPLVYLEAEGPLSKSMSSLNLNAHIQALKKGGDEGPYLLKNIRIERWSDEIISMDVAGKVNQEIFSVEGFKFDAFDDVPYIDPLNAERIKLMEGLGGL